MTYSADIITVQQAAEILHLSARAVRHRILTGTLAATKLPGRTGSYVLSRADVEAAAKAAA